MLMRIPVVQLITRFVMKLLLVLLFLLFRHPLGLTPKYSLKARDQAAEEENPQSKAISVIAL